DQWEYPWVIQAESLVVRGHPRTELVAAKVAFGHRAYSARLDRLAVLRRRLLLRIPGRTRASFGNRERCALEFRCSIFAATLAGIRLWMLGRVLRRPRLGQCLLQRQSPLWRERPDCRDHQQPARRNPC